jgi:hypothetical protein
VRPAMAVLTGKGLRHSKTNIQINFFISSSRWH